MPPKRGGAVLLFDEADALFGKRSEVKDSHDRYANIATISPRALDSTHGHVEEINIVIQFPFFPTLHSARRAPTPDRWTRRARLFKPIPW